MIQVIVTLSRPLNFGLLIALLLSTVLPGKSARAQSTPPPSYTFDECDQVKETSLRDELNRTTQAVFEEGQGGIDVAALVNRNWVALNLDSAVDKTVATATKRVKDETKLGDLLISNWSPEKARELTKMVATYAFNSKEFRDSVDVLASNVSDDVVAEFRVMTAKSASSALLCVQTFIGDTISTTLAALLEKETHDRLHEIEDLTDEELALIDLEAV